MKLNKKFCLWLLLAVWAISGTLRAQSPARAYGVGAAMVVGSAVLSVGAQLLVERLSGTGASDSLILSKKIVLEVCFVPTYALGLQGNNRPKGALLAHNPGMHQYTEVRYFPSKNISVGLGLRSGAQFINGPIGESRSEKPPHRCRGGGGSSQKQGRIAVFRTIDRGLLFLDAPDESGIHRFGLRRIICALLFWRRRH